MHIFPRFTIEKFILLIPLMVVIGALVERENCYFNYVGTLTFFIFFILIYMGMKMVGNVKVKIEQTLKINHHINNITNAVIGISFVGALLYLKVFVDSFGSLYALITAGWEIRERMASGDIKTSLFINALAMSGYAAIFLSMYIYYKDGVMKKFFISMIPLIITSIAQAARAGILMTLIFLLSTVIAKYAILKDDRKIYNMFGKLVLIALAVFISGAILRDAEQSFQNIINVARDYALGGFLGFNQWIQNYTIDWPSLGKYTFASLYIKFYPDGLPIGYYDEYLDICKGSETNIFTLYRSLIEDYTFPGAFLIAIIIGYFVKYSYNKLKNGRDEYLPLFIYLYTLIIYSIIAPLTQHTALIVALIFSSFVIRFFNDKKN